MKRLCALVLTLALVPLAGFAADRSESPGDATAAVASQLHAVELHIRAALDGAGLSRADRAIVLGLMSEIWGTHQRQLLAGETVEAVDSLYAQFAARLSPSIANYGLRPQLEGLFRQKVELEMALLRAGGRL